MSRIAGGKGFELEIPTSDLEMIEDAEKTIVQLTVDKQGPENVEAVEG